jgi:hypothetical protein
MLRSIEGFTTDLGEGGNLPDMPENVAEALEQEAQTPNGKVREIIRWTIQESRYVRASQ